MTREVGRVALVPVGEYSSSQTYSKLDIVSYDGSSYVCLIDDCIGKKPDENIECWQPMAVKGDTGATGADGQDGKTPVKGEDYFDENDKKEIVDNVVTEIDKNYEPKHAIYKKEVTEEIEELTEYELPFSYTVGNDSLVVFLNNERLICEKTEDDQANYKEVGETGATSNKLIFGFTLDVGDILDFIVKGVVEDEKDGN